MAKGIKILCREAWSMCLRSTAARSAVADDLKLLLPQNNSVKFSQQFPNLRNGTIF